MNPESLSPNAREGFALLCAELPPPPDKTPEARTARERGAMDAVFTLNPENAFEARLAVRIVAMDAHAADCLRLAGLAADDPMEMRRCRAQAASMARQADAALRALLRIQATREKQEAAMHPAAMERAGYWFKEVQTPPPSAPMQAEPPNPPFEEMTEAERYAVLYPERAVRIRTAGGLPASLDFGPPEPEIVDAIVHGDSSILRALDRPGGVAVPA